MNRQNKEKLKQVKEAESYRSHMELFLQRLPFIKKWYLVFNVVFHGRRGCLFLTNIHIGMSAFSAYCYSFENSMEDVANRLELNGWQVSFGKLD